MNKEEIEQYNRIYYEAHREERKAYNKNYRKAHKEERKMYVKNYRQAKYENDKRYRQKYPERYQAKNEVSHAVRDGRLIKQPCAMCGNINVEAHHEDYSKPLEVIWLCSDCHKKLHGSRAVSPLEQYRRLTLCT